MCIKLPTHLRDVAMIGETVIAIVPDDNMLMDGDTHKSGVI